MSSIPEDLIIRFVNNSCSDEELTAVRQWLDESDDHAAELFGIENTVSQAASLRCDDAVRSRLRSRIDMRIAADNALAERKSRRSFILRMTGVAAILAIAVAAGVYLLRTPEINMVSISAGDEVRLAVLPDDTKVYLNGHSTLTYPETFASDCRQVELDGEGYFEVTHDSTRPFRVSGHSLDVEVLGTHFNFVSSRSDSSSVSLLEGSVRVSSSGKGEGVVLEPGQKAVYSAATGRLSVRNTNASVDACWHDRMISFENASVADIADILRRLYGARIELDANVDRTKTYSGVTEYCGSLDSTLSNLCITIPIRFTNSGNVVKIYSR